MVFTTIGQSGTLLAIGSLSPNRPQYLAIGSGSGTALASNVVLLGEELRTSPTSTTLDIPTLSVQYIADWNSVQMSGIGLREFGMFSDSVASTGSLWSRDAFSAVEFDGTNELQVQLTYEMY